MSRTLCFVAVAALLAACATEEEKSQSKAVGTPNDLGVEAPEVNTGWPCPPFDNVETDENGNGDDDEDGLTNCVEEYWNSDPNNPDSDGDSVEECSGEPFLAFAQPANHLCNSENHWAEPVLSSKEN